MRFFSVAIVAIVTMLFGGGKNASVPLSPVINIHDASCHCKPSRVVKQKNSCLMWQDEPYTNSEDGAYKRDYSVGKAGSYTHALNYCRSLIYAGFSDWRLPTAEEMEKMHDLRGSLFYHQRDGDFWTSTPSVEGKYYVVFSADAIRYKRRATQSNYIRCVRCVSLYKKKKYKHKEPLLN